MKNVAHDVAKSCFNFDGHTEKMKRANGSRAPSLFEDTIGSNENSAVVRTLSKKKLSQLE